MVTSFYSKVLASPVLSRHFAGIPMEVLVAKQAAFIDATLRGDSGYSSAELHHTHAHLQVDNTDFDELMLILDASLGELVTDAEARSRIHGTFASFREAIISAAPS